MFAADEAVATKSAQKSKESLNLNHYCISTIRTTKKYRDGGKFLTLAEYTEIAKKCISRCANWTIPGIAKQMLKSEDAISLVITFLADADSKYEESFGLTRQQFRGLYASYAIRKYVKMGKLSSSKSILSLDSIGHSDTYHQEQAGSLVGKIADEKALDPIQELLNNELHDYLNGYSSDDLTERQYFILYEHLVNKTSLAELGRKLGITTQRTGQIFLQAKRKVNFQELKNAA